VRDLTWPPSPKGAPAFCRVGTCRKPGSRGSLVVQSTPGTPRGPVHPGNSSWSSPPWKLLVVQSTPETPRGPVHPGNSSWSSPPRKLLVVQSTPETPRGGRVRSRPRFARHSNIGLLGTGSSALPTFATYALDRRRGPPPHTLSTPSRMSGHCGFVSFATAGEAARRSPRPGRRRAPRFGAPATMVVAVCDGGGAARARRRRGCVRSRGGVTD